MTDSAGRPVGFQSEGVFTEVLLGGQSGSLKFTFITPPDQPNYETVIGPKLTVMLAQQLQFAASNVPSLSDRFGLDLPGRKPAKGKTATYFGQEYPVPILQALGVLMVRVNLLEVSLVELLGVIGGLTLRQAEALFFSTVNMKARFDMIRALAANSDLPLAALNNISDAIARARAVTERRNDLVHGRWSFLGDKFEVTRIEPNTTKALKPQVVTRKSLEQLATDYRLAGAFVKACVPLLSQERSMAEKTSRTPSSGEPDS
jgi:hypothetical protein